MNCIIGICILVDFDVFPSEKLTEFSHKTAAHVFKMFEICGTEKIFGRGAVCELLDLKKSGVSKLIGKLVQADLIEPVSGHGKGKYRFIKK